MTSSGRLEKIGCVRSTVNDNGDYKNKTMIRFLGILKQKNTEMNELETIKIIVQNFLVFESER